MSKHPPERRADLVIALFGPTGVGKTAIACHVAQELGTRVVSCDSMQLYRGFPVLTNQPQARETLGVVQELVDVADPDVEWSAVEYARRARPLLEEDLSRTGFAVIAGGTGLYLRAALAPLSAPAPGDPALRRRLEERAAREGAATLHRRLASLDPEAAGAIHPSNTRRLVRALEVLMSSPERRWSGRCDLWAPDYYHHTLLVGLTMDRESLYRRVDHRARMMFEGGAVEEVKAHRARVAASAPMSGESESRERRGVERAIGYREIDDFLDGGISADEAVARLAAATRKYVRRQDTWMRKLQGAVIIDTSRRTAEESAALILAEARRARVLSTAHRKDI
ncbi:MAG: tRNA (adenosine(37)-N6)-dimethylallyltransferase MiaA [Actinobacteria bacterium]|nr:tRNA (adenosine(37)-N6)-dimethylallyltransferase MiaA [Actinomycetota bacterium]